MNCPFCEKINIESDSILWENENTACILPREMNAKGHVLVIPKMHKENMLSMTKDEFEEFSKFMHDVAHKLKTALAADGVNILSAHGKAAQQSVDHMHFHLIPRWEKDGLDLWPKLEENIEEGKEELKELLKNSFRL